jgi:hypothetical protein
MKHQIIPTDPHGSAQSHYPDQHKVPLLFRKTSKPRTKRYPTSTGFLTPKVKHTIPHTSLVMGQTKNRCRIDSYPAQKQHLIHPFHLLFTKLSLVNTTPFLRYQRKILIFKGILALRTQQFTGNPDLKARLLYISLTENFLLTVQHKESL